MTCKYNIFFVVVVAVFFCCASALLCAVYNTIIMYYVCLNDMIFVIIKFIYFIFRCLYTSHSIILLKREFSCFLDYLVQNLKINLFFRLLKNIWAWIFISSRTFPVIYLDMHVCWAEDKISCYDSTNYAHQGR